MTKLPYFPFYPSDWIKDTRVLTLEARAIWLDLLTLMHDSGRRGYLYNRSGSPYSIADLARYAGCPIETATRVVQELIDSGVASCTDSGVLFSRRMVKDERKRKLCAAAGKKGGGNPVLKETFKGQPKGGDKGAPKGAFSIEDDSLLSSSPKGGLGGESELPAVLDTPLFRDVWRRWLQHRAEIRKPLKPTTTAAQLKKLAGWGLARAVAALEHTIAQGWTGIFEPPPEALPRLSLFSAAKPSFADKQTAEFERFLNSNGTVPKAVNHDAH